MVWWNLIRLHSDLEVVKRKNGCEMPLSLLGFQRPSLRNTQIELCVFGSFWLLLFFAQLLHYESLHPSIFILLPGGIIENIFPSSQGRGLKYFQSKEEGPQNYSNISAAKWTESLLLCFKVNNYALNYSFVHRTTKAFWGHLYRWENGSAM